MNSITASDALIKLNKLLKDDRDTVENLVSLRVDCTKLEFANEALIPHKSRYSRSLAGVVEIVNYLLHPSAIIVPVYNPRGELIKFRLMPLEDR